jgi:hypothetical protein
MTASLEPDDENESRYHASGLHTQSLDIAEHDPKGRCRLAPGPGMEGFGVEQETIQVEQASAGSGHRTSLPDATPPCQRSTGGSPSPSAPLRSGGSSGGGATT